MRYVILLKAPVMQFQNKIDMYFQGCPPADAHKMMEKGMTTKFEIAKIGEKTWRAIMTCKEIPAMNDVRVSPVAMLKISILNLLPQ